MTTRVYRLALLCGALPLGAGLSVFLLWAAFRWDWLMPAGVSVILGGLVFFLFGLSCLSRFHLSALEDGRISYRRRFWQTAAAACLLVSNFPAAAGIVASVVHIQTRYSVTVINESDEAVEAVTISGGGVTAEFGTIQPGDRSRRSFHIQHDDVLMCTGIQRGERLETEIDGYVTSGLGGDKLVRITPKGTVDVTDRFR